MSHAYINRTKQIEQWKKGRNFSFIVGVMRVLLPALIILYIIIYGYLLTRDNSEVIISDELARQIKNLDSYTSIEAPKFVGHNPEKKMNYSSTALTAAKKIEEPDQTFLIDTKSIIEDEKTLSIITSDQGMHNAKNNSLFLYQNIILKTDRGLKANFHEAELFLDEGKMFSYQPVYIETNSSIVIADDMEMRDNGGVLIFRKNPKMKLLLEEDEKK